MFGLTSPLRKEIKARGLQYLLHSTHLFENLPQILTDGKLQTARTIIEAHGHDQALRFLHDPFRYEQFAVGLDYVNCSLTLPNAELLYRRSKSDWKTEWVHMALDLKLLERNETLFAPVSAAAERGKHLQTGAEGLRAIFADTVEGYDRKDLRADGPTHPQAEILIKGAVEWKEIRAIFVPNGIVLEGVKDLCARAGRKIEIAVKPQLFVWPKRLMKG
jgi:hypothetical protein